MTEQDNRTDDNTFRKPTLEEEYENLVEQHGSLKEAPLHNITHFENYRRALQAQKTRAELKKELADSLQSGLKELNGAYDEINENEEFDFEETDYLSERSLAQLATMAESVTLTGINYQHSCTQYWSKYEAVSNIYFERLENSYLKPSVWIKRKLQAFKERFNR